VRQNMRSCGWCGAIHKTSIPRPTKVFCNIGCRDADNLFELMFSDEEINRRTHYAEITKGTAQGYNSPKEGGT